MILGWVFRFLPRFVSELKNIQQVSYRRNLYMLCAAVSARAERCAYWKQTTFLTLSILGQHQTTGPTKCGLQRRCVPPAGMVQVEADQLDSSRSATSWRRGIESLEGGFACGAKFAARRRARYICDARNVKAGLGGEQGVATTMYAVVAPELEGRSGVYLSDCAIAAPSRTARDPKQASTLWEVTTAQLAAAKAGTFQGGTTG